MSPKWALASFTAFCSRRTCIEKDAATVPLGSEEARRALEVRSVRRIAENPRTVVMLVVEGTADANACRGFAWPCSVYRQVQFTPTADLERGPHAQNVRMLPKRDGRTVRV
eukprot:4185184-Pleurochrysis_carterae.AAC.1